MLDTATADAASAAASSLSSTSSTLDNILPLFFDFIFILSIFSRCKSVILKFLLSVIARFSNSFTLDITSHSSPSSDIHIGNGVPQYLLRDTAQSRAFDNQL